MADSSDFREPHLRRGDFLGAFAVLERAGRYLMVKNARHIGGRQVDTWDLPGGQVEPGELLQEALRRELAEETGLCAVGDMPFLFLQEGEMRVGDRRLFAWRSFFFGVEEATGIAAPDDDILELAWMTEAELQAVLRAPYHDSFREWLSERGRFYSSVWQEPG